VKIGLVGLNTQPCVTPDAIAAVARAAEQAGFDSFWGGEHLILPDPMVRMPPETRILDLLTTISFAAAHTHTLRFATGVILLPQRNPLVLAKEIATADVLSGGRLILGFGISSFEVEFKALGIPFANRGRRAEEALAAMKAIWTMEKPRFQGEFFSFSGVRAEPRPLQQPHPPIVWGGRTVYAFGRTVRSGSGWYGYDMSLADAAEMMAKLGQACARHGRRIEEFEVTITPKAEPALDADLARRFADLGVGRLTVAPRAADVDGVMRVIERTQRELIGKV